MKKIITLLALVFLTFSCSSDDSSDETPPVNGELITLGLQLKSTVTLIDFASVDKKIYVNGTLYPYTFNTGESPMASVLCKKGDIVRLKMTYKAPDNIPVNKYLKLYSQVNLATGLGSFLFSNLYIIDENTTENETTVVDLLIATDSHG